jgi:uncharacterized protein DUF1236
VRKMKLLSTVAAALLLSAGAATAQGVSKDTPERAPAAQQSAPAEKMAPSMKSNEQKVPQTTGQATPDAKSGKGPATTGQSPKSANDDKMQKSGSSMDKSDKSGASATDKSKASGSTGSNQNVQSPNATSPRSSQSTTEQSSSSTTGQGAAGSARLSTEQRTKITSIIKQQNVERVEPSRLNVSLTVGTRIPTTVRFHPLPQQVIVVYPEWRGYDYILVGDQIVIIHPRTREIVAIIEA